MGVAESSCDGLYLNTLSRSALFRGAGETGPDGSWVKLKDGEQRVVLNSDICVVFAALTDVEELG